MTLVACLRVAFALRSSLRHLRDRSSAWLPRGPVSPGRRANLARPQRVRQAVRARGVPAKSELKGKARAGDTGCAGYPPRMRIDEIIAARRPTFSVEFFPPKTEEATEQLYATARELARAGARLRLGHLRRRRLDPRRHGRDHHGAEGRARLRDDGPPELRRRDDRGAGDDAGPDRGGGDRERLRPARRPAARRRRTSSSPRAGWAAPPSWPRSSAPAGTSRSAAPASPRCTPRRPTSRPTSPT